MITMSGVALMPGLVAVVALVGVIDMIVNSNSIRVSRMFGVDGAWVRRSGR